MSNEKIKKNEASYKDSGVDIDAANIMLENVKPFIKATKRLGSDPQIGGFGGLFDLKALNYKDPLLVAANDGVGTKLKIAIETGCHDTIGIDLVAMCVNDLIVQGAEPLFFLDYFATGKLDPQAGQEIIAGIAKGCQLANCALIGGETAEMPGLYQEKDYDLAGFSVGIVERDALLPRKDIEENDVILGLGSSGLHSNGFSLVRKILAQSGLNFNDNAPFAPTQTVGQALLTPTKIYVNSVLKALKNQEGIKALAHITGGGFDENIPRILPTELGATLNLDAIEVPAVFSWLASQGPVRQSEMLRVFNCGIGMIVVVAQDKVKEITQSFIDQGEKVYTLGVIDKRKEEQPAIRYTGSLNL